MVENEQNNDKIWKEFLRNHWKFCIIVVVGVVIAISGAVLVFLWRVSEAPTALGTPVNIGNWTVGFMVIFILNLILWEFLIIGIPILVAIAACYLLWWNKLPEEEKEKYKGDPKKKGSRKRITTGHGGGLISLIVTITWLIIVWIRGYWNIAFSAWAFNTFVNFILWACLWDLIIFGIPIILLIIFWIRHEMKEES
ncbi:MAG: hypothetical protein ACFFD2_03825 [Promethearchaeota archaeon]